MLFGEKRKKEIVKASARKEKNYINLLSLKHARDQMIIRMRQPQLLNC